MSESLIQPDKTYYSERQQFRQWWIWILVLIVPSIFLWIIFQQIVMNSQIGDNFANDYILFIPALIFGVGLPLFIYSMGLDTEVRACGVWIRFRPFHRKWLVFGFKNIQKAEAHTYSPMKDYGGWGIRYGTKGKAYTVSGNKGLFLTMSDGKNVLIGSKNHELLFSAVNERLSSEN